MIERHCFNLLNMYLNIVFETRLIQFIKTLDRTHNISYNHSKKKKNIILQVKKKVNYSKLTDRRIKVPYDISINNNSNMNNNE